MHVSASAARPGSADVYTGRDSSLRQQGQIGVVAEARCAGTLFELFLLSPAQ
jgi:hypothetical protein